MDQSPSNPQTLESNQDPTDQNLNNQDPDQKPNEEENQEHEEEEAAECGFCLFMKGGGCKDQFVAWENCVEEAEKNKEDIAEKCFEITSKLKTCMDAHSDYYEPILRAEKAMSDAVTEEEELEKVEKEKGESNEENVATVEVVLVEEDKAKA